MHAKRIEEFTLPERLLAFILRAFYRMRHPRDEQAPKVSLLEAVESFGAPVYGLVESFMELLPDGRSYSSDEIGLSYQRNWLEDEEAKPGVQIETRNVNEVETPWEWTAFQVRMAAQGAAFEFGSRSFRERQMAKEQGLTQIFGDFPMEAIHDVAVGVPGFPRATTVWRWSVPEPVHAMLLQNDATRLIVSAFALTTEEFRSLTCHLGPLSHAQMTQYEAKAEACWRGYERRLLKEFHE